MKYYAVANDSAELMHFGIKGMKWGVRRTDAQLGHFKKPRSTAYHKASAKLNSLMQNGIKKAQTKWNTYNSPENKEYRVYNRAVNKQIRENKHREKLFEKHVQLAREGRLKYKGISDAEVERITDRLALERNARNLSGAEKQSFARRLKSSVGEGIIEGVGRGTSSYIDARMKGRGQTTAQIKADKRLDRYNSKYSTQERKQRLEDMEQARKDRSEYKKIADEEGYSGSYAMTLAEKRAYVKKIKDRRESEDIDREYDRTYAKRLAQENANNDAEDLRIKRVEQKKAQKDQQALNEARARKILEEREAQQLLQARNEARAQQIREEQQRKAVERLAADNAEKARQQLAKRRLAEEAEQKAAKRLAEEHKRAEEQAWRDRENRLHQQEVKRMMAQEYDYQARYSANASGLRRSNNANINRNSGKRRSRTSSAHLFRQ